MDSMSEQLWDVNDVAKYLKVSRSWVYHRVAAGLLPCTRIGALVRFRASRIRALARESERSSPEVGTDR
jgi:excisionase family DNA binding protein